MVELRKRPAPPPAPPPAKKKATAAAAGKGKGKAKKDAPVKADAPAASSKAAAPEPDEAEAAPEPEPEAAPAPAPTKSGPPKVGDTIALDGFGGEIETHEGEKTSLAQLVAASQAGVVLFTYPKASTPGCTTQACLFRDSYEPLTATGLSIFGLSTDSPKANTTFKTKQKLPYALLCDPAATLIQAIGFKRAPKGTTRAVFVVDKSGKVLAAEAGGPAPTVEVVKKLVAAAAPSSSSGADAEKSEGDAAAAETAAEVADTAEKIDGA